MMRHPLTLTAALLLALAPVAAAQEDPETKPEEPQDGGNAWVEDCPPDMMCAYGGDEPQPYGNESCIECSGTPQDQPVDDSSNCMDGEQANETCRDDVRYLDGGNGDPEPAPVAEDAGVEESAGGSGDTGANPVPAAGGLLVGAALLGAALVAARRR